MERVGDAGRLSLALTDFENSGNDLLGYVAGLGVVLGVLALIVVGGRMIHANFTGDPWIAARGMADLPWVVLGVVLLIASGSLSANLLQGSVHGNGGDLAAILENVEEGQDGVEEGAADCEDGGALQDPDNGRYLCPDDDGWDELARTAPVDGPYDPRCTVGDFASDCYQFCNMTGFYPFRGKASDSPCSAEPMQAMTQGSWIWADYHCPNLSPYWWGAIADCRGDYPEPPENAMPWPFEFDSNMHMEIYSEERREYSCRYYRDWVDSVIAAADRMTPEEYCAGFPSEETTGEDGTDDDDSGLVDI